MLCILGILLAVSSSTLAQQYRPPPGVNPNQYQAPGQVPQQQYQQQHIPQQQFQQQQAPQQQFQQQQVPQQQFQQQVPQQQFQQQPPQQQQFQQQAPQQQQRAPQQGVPQQQFQRTQPQQQAILKDKQQIKEDKEHIKEHIGVPMDTAGMSEEELQFHYFKMHDADNNNKLDGLELVASLQHWHESDDDLEGINPAAGMPMWPEDTLVEVIDRTLLDLDKNEDGLIDWTEFQATTAAAAPQDRR